MKKRTRNRNTADTDYMATFRISLALRASEVFRSKKGKGSYNRKMMKSKVKEAGKDY